jgi:hypothetical protein
MGHTDKPVKHIASVLLEGYRAKDRMKAGKAPGKPPADKKKAGAKKAPAKAAIAPKAQKRAAGKKS